MLLNEGAKSTLRRFIETRSETMRVFITYMVPVWAAFFLIGCAKGGGSLSDDPPCDKITVRSDDKLLVHWDIIVLP